MTTQVNVRISDDFLSKAKDYANKKGFENIQDLIKEALREKIYDESETKKELELIKKFVLLSKNPKLFGSEEELFKKLNK